MSMVTNYVTDRMEVNISKPVDTFVISSVRVPAAIQTEMDALREEREITFSQQPDIIIDC